MIDKNEIDSMAVELGVHTANVERDYVFGWLLKAFYENDFLRSMLVFKGGNCMRKGYFRNTRFSSDLDFSVSTYIDPVRFISELNHACSEAKAACDVEFVTDKNTFSAENQIDEKRQSYKGRIYFRDFYGNQANLLISVRVDVTEFDKIYLPTQTKNLIHPYSDSSKCSADIVCMSLEELLANKLKCLIQRRHSFDLYDFVYATFFEKSIDLDRSLILRTFLKKTIFEPSPGAAKEILLGLPMAFFSAAWNKYIVCPIASRIDFGSAEKGFSSFVEELFSGISIWRGRVEPFYPSHYRNLILEAGSARKLLRIMYDGVEREIEPYSLVYKRRQDGNAFEYFYAWDRTGGRTSGPGIKTFFQHKVQNLEPTEVSFEPRFPIELTKAGEPVQGAYFGKPFSDGNRNTRASLVRSGGTRFTVECPYCQKRFPRSSYTTELRPHKDANGYPCAGRRGYLV